MWLRPGFLNEHLEMVARGAIGDGVDCDIIGLSKGDLMKFLIYVLAVAAIAACGQSSKDGSASKGGDIQADLRKKLVNPESTKFGDVIESADGKSACLMFDSKGTTGQYMGWGSALLHKQGDKWVITAVNGNPAECRLKK